MMSGFGESVHLCVCRQQPKFETEAAGVWGGEGGPHIPRHTAPPSDPRDMGGMLSQKLQLLEEKASGVHMETSGSGLQPGLRL